MAEWLCNLISQTVMFLCAHHALHPVLEIIQVKHKDHFELHIPLLYMYIA